MHWSFCVQHNKMRAALHSTVIGPAHDFPGCAQHGAPFAKSSQSKSFEMTYPSFITDSMLFYEKNLFAQYTITHRINSLQ